MTNRINRSFVKAKGNAFLHFGLLIAFLALAPSVARALGCDGAGNCYVRSGATGSGNGVDWANAYTSLPANLTRGVTYYIAAGTYPGHLFADPDSGSTYITVQSATASSHGTSTGWSNSYAGQAVFNKADPSGVGDIFTFQSDYYIIDGVGRSTASGMAQTDWTNESSYGMKLDNSGKVACNADISLGDNSNTVPLPVHHINIEYVDVNGSHESSSNGCRENGFAGMWGSHDYSIQNSYIHNTGLTILFLRGEHVNCSGSSGKVTCGSPSGGYGNGSNIVVQNNYFNNNFSDPNQHAEGCSCSEGLQNLTIADNYWQDINGTGIIATASGADWNNGNGGNGPWYINGNVVFETSCSVFSGVKNAGVAGLFYKWDTTFIAPIYILNNTVYNFPASCNSGSGIMLDDGAYAAPATAVYVENNLWANAAQTQVLNSCPSSSGYASCTSINWGYNAYFASPDNSGSSDSDRNAQISNSAAPFVSAGSYNFMLTSNTTAGTSTNSIASANGVDLLGTTRGADGTWDRGALQMGGSTATLKSISITPANVSIPVSETQQLTATGVYSDGSSQNLTNSVTWSSSNSAVASVGNGGLVSSLSAGTTTIQATSGTLSGSTTITVSSATLQSITISPAKASLMAGNTLQFTATGNYNNGTTQNLTNSVTWSSSTTSAATISASGLATGKSVGSTTIQAVSGSISSSTTLNVTAVATLQSIALSPSTFTIAAGSTQQLTATGTYSDGSTQNVTSSATWSTSSSANATVSGSGLVTAQANGSATITATVGSLSATATATVSNSPSATAWWNFNAGSGTAAVDTTGHNHLATLHNGITWIANGTGSSVSSNGKNQFASTSPIYLTSTKAVTWTAWIKRTYGSGQGALIESSSNFNLSTTGFGFFPDDSQDCGIAHTIMTGVHGNVGYTLNCYAQPTSGVWHHFAAVYDKSQTGAKVISLYIDGVLQTPVRQMNTSTNTNSFGSDNLYLFSRGGVSNFNASQVDDLRLFSSALSASQIAQIYKQGAQ